MALDQTTACSTQEHTASTENTSELTELLAQLLKKHGGPKKLHEVLSGAPGYTALSKEAQKELWRGTKTHCINGHKYTAKTTQINAYGKYLQRRCKTCQSEKNKLRYRNTPGRREALIARARTAK